MPANDVLDIKISKKCMSACKIGFARLEQAQILACAMLSTRKELNCESGVLVHSDAPPSDKSLRKGKIPETSTSASTQICVRADAQMFGIIFVRQGISTFEEKPQYQMILAVRADARRPRGAKNELQEKSDCKV